MVRITKNITTLFLFASSTHSLHIISRDTTSIPYLIPRFFQTACDPSDGYFSEEVTVATSADASSVISFASPPQNVTSACIRRSPNVWTHEPFCLESVEAQNGVCVYTNSKFANGRGISIVATPADISLVQQAAIFKNGGHENAKINLEGEKKYVRKAVPGGKGYEVIANATIKRGEELHTLTPLLAVQEPYISYMTKKDQTLLMRIGIERLSVKSKETFLSQYSQPKKDPYVDRMDKNAFNTQFGHSNHFYTSAVPETARFNHDCRPNVVYHFNPENFTHHSFAVRDIKPGEEITDSYLPPYMNYTERRIHLELQWGFKCACRFCASSPKARRESDARLHRIEAIIKEINVPPPQRKLNPVLIEELVSLHEKEELWGPIAGAHMYAAMEYEVIGNKKKAKDWARIAKKGLKMWSGVGHEYYAAMQRILEEEIKDVPYTRLLGKGS